MVVVADVMVRGWGWLGALRGGAISGSGGVPTILGRDMEDIIGGLFGVAFGLGCQCADLVDVVRNLHLVADDTNGERNERKLVWSTFAVDADNRTAGEVIGGVESDAFTFVEFEDLPVEYGGPVGSRNNEKIVAADMADEIVSIAMFQHNALANVADEQDHMVTSEETVDIIEGFEIIQVNIEDAPGVFRTQFVVDSALQL